MKPFYYYLNQAAKAKGFKSWDEWDEYGDELFYEEVAEAWFDQRKKEYAREAVLKDRLTILKNLIQNVDQKTIETIPIELP